MHTPANNPFSDLLKNISKAPPRDPRELPGLGLWGSLGRSVLLVLLPFFLFFSLLPILIITTDKDSQAQFRKLRRAQGKVLSTQRMQLTSQGYSQTVIKYSFRTNAGAVYYGSSSVPNDSPFALLKRGAPLPILYAADDPSFNGIAGVLGKNAPPLALLFTLPLLFLLFFSPFFLFPLLLPFRQILQARNIFRHGILTVGRVHFVKKSRNISPSYPFTHTFEVLYSFEDEAGQTIQGSQVCDNEWLLDKLDVGTEITVAYLPKRRGRSIFLEPFIA